MDDSLIGRSSTAEISENIPEEEITAAAIYNTSVRYIWGQRCLFISFLSMIPFMILEISTILIYRRDWITMWNIFNLINIYNQVIIK